MSYRTEVRCDTVECTAVVVPTLLGAMPEGWQAITLQTSLYSRPAEAPQFHVCPTHARQFLGLDARPA